MTASPAHPAAPRRRGAVTIAAVAVGSAIAIAGGGFIAGSTAAAPSSDPAAVSVTPPGPAGFGVFYVNGKQQPSNWSDNRGSQGRLPTSGLTSTKRQARITYLRPQNPTKPNIVLVPGYGLAADIYMTTPDLREGWAQLLYAQGYPVYVVSPPDRGESMSIDGINKCIAGAVRKVRCKGQDMKAYYGQIGHATLEDPWETWRFGPTYGVPYGNSQFPSLPLKENYVEQFGASFVPYLGTSDIQMVDNTIMNDLTTESLESLLAEIGPSVVVLHSAAGTGGFAAAINDAAMVKAVVAIETTKCPPDKPNGVSPMADTPFLGIWGDHISEKSPGGHWDRRASCEKMAASIDATGRAPAQVISLPNRGIYGNSHLMMQDDNNAQVLSLITDWLTEHRI